MEAASILQAAHLGQYAPAAGEVSWPTVVFPLLWGEAPYWRRGRAVPGAAPPHGKHVGSVCPTPAA